MSTMEHLIMQIFDRKSWIEEQLRHQSQSYDESLAYNLLAQGKRPPPWLWPSGSNGCDLPDPKGQNSDRPLQGMLFPLPCAATPSANNSTYFTLPVFKGYEVSLPNKPTEAHASELVLPECSENAVPSASKLTSDRITEPEILARAGFVPRECEQHSDSWQRKEEIRPSGSEKSASYLGQSSNIENYTGKMSQSRAHSSMPDDVRESSGLNSSLHHRNKDGGRVTRSRTRSAAKANHLDQMLQPLDPLSSIENDLHKAVGCQSDMSSVPPVNLDMCTTSTCISGTVEMELVRADNVGESSTIITLNDSLHPHKGDGSIVTQSRLRSEAQTDSLDKLRESVNSLNCIEGGILKVVESRTEIPSIQNFDHLQTSITETAVLSTTSPAHSCLKVPSVEPKKLLFDGIEEHGLNKSSGIPSVKKNQRSFGVVLTNLEAVSVNKELLCEDCEKVDGDEKDVSQNSIDEGVRSSNYGRNQNGELLEVENSRSCSYVTPGVQIFHQDVNKKSSLEILAKEQHSTKSREVMSGLDYMPAEMNSPIDPQHPACDSRENRGLAINCSTSLQKGTKKNLKVLKSMKETFGSIPVQTDSSSLNHQPEEILDTVELMSGTEEANIALQEKLDLSKSLKSDLISLPESNPRDSHVPTISYLDIGSLNPESDPTCSALDAECVSFSGDQLIMSDGYKNSPLGASTMCPIEENFKEKLITETGSIYIQTICNVQIGGSALPSQTGELLEALLGDERNSSINCEKFSGSCNSSDSVIPSSSAAVCLSAHAMSMGITEGNLAKKSRSPKTSSSQQKVPYLLMSSTENCGSMLANGSVSCSVKNSLPPSDINIACPEDLTGKKVNCSWVTPNSIEVQSEQAKSRYLLRSLNSRDRNVASIKSNDACHLKKPIKNFTQESEISWPKRRKVGNRSNNILATSPRLRLKHFPHIQDSCDCSFNNKTSSEVELQPVPMATQSETGILNAVSGSPCKSLDHSKIHRTTEGYPYLNHNVQISATPLLCEHAQHELLCDITNRKSEISLKDDIRVSEATIYKLQNHSLSEDCHDSLCETIRSSCGHEEQHEDGESYNTRMSSHAHNTASIPEYDHALVGFDDNMPEFEGFSIAFPSVVEDDTIYSDSNLPTLAKERAFALDLLCKSKEVLTPSMHTSLKYKIHKVPDCYQSLPAGLLESLSCSLHFNDQDMKHHKESCNEQLAGIYGNSEIEVDYSLVGRQYPFSMPISSSSSNVEFKKPPLTPPLMKFGQKIVSCRSGASSEKVGSNPELVCFRIDENSSIADENGHIDGTSLRKSTNLINRKALNDISVEFQNKPILESLTKRILDRDSLESVNSVVSVDLSPARGCTIQRESKVELKENNDLTANRKVRKAALSLRNRSNKPRVSQKTIERSRSHGNLEKGCKASNVVSNISSFIPLVCQKQQAAAPLKGRKDIKVKALEAAEAAKRIEEKKQSEREMRKAAAKLEREKMEQENIRQMVLKQKRKEEERKKKEVEIAARKRLREEEGRKGKERKRRCTEETRGQKKEEGNFHAGKVERELQIKASDGKQHRNEKVEAVKVQLKPEKIGCQKSTVMQPSITKVSAVDDKNDGAVHEAHNYLHKSSIIEKVVTSPDRLQEVVRTRSFIKKESGDVQSYEMSPYIDSDDEDGDDDIRRERKCIPLWARRECLDQIILSKRDLDPVEIFSRKRSFIIEKVLPSANLRRLVK